MLLSLWNDHVYLCYVTDSSYLFINISIVSYYVIIFGINNTYFMYIYAAYGHLICNVPNKTDTRQINC